MAFNDYMQQQMAGIRYGEPGATEYPAQPAPTPQPSPEGTPGPVYFEDGSVGVPGQYPPLRQYPGPPPDQSAFAQFLMYLLMDMQKGMGKTTPPATEPMRVDPSMLSGLFGGGSFTPR